MVHSQNPIDSIMRPDFLSARTRLSAWKALADHHRSLSKELVLKDLFKKDPEPASTSTLACSPRPPDGCEVLFDFSKNFLTDDTFKLLVELAKEAGLEKLRDDMFAGEKINFTEKRAVYHVALRNVDEVPHVGRRKVCRRWRSERSQLHRKEFSEQVRSGGWKGYTGKKMETIINIGIGGSDL